jgi:hypothetical protein
VVTRWHNDLDSVDFVRTEQWKLRQHESAGGHWDAHRSSARLGEHGSFRRPDYQCHSAMTLLGRVKSGSAVEAIGVTSDNSLERNWRGRRDRTRTREFTYMLAHRKEGPTLTVDLKRGCCQNSYLLQVSLTILRVVTRRSPYSSLLDAFSTRPSFCSLFSSAFVSRAVEPVTVTWWPTC